MFIAEKLSLSFSKDLCSKCVASTSLRKQLEFGWAGLHTMIYHQPENKNDPKLHACSLKLVNNDCTANAPVHHTMTESIS